MSAAFKIYLVFMVAFRCVSSWTIDLPEVREYFFEKNGIYDDNEKKVYPDRETAFYSNIEGNSLHNSNFFEKYASQYEYQSYMEKKVHGAVINGSRYLEGLRRALEQYIDSLETCNTVNFSMNGSLPFSNTTSWRSQMESPLPQNRTSNSTSNSIVCERATRASEHVRRLAMLAGWATRELQEKIYTKKHQKESGASDKVLILKLAWFLDRLAHLTGYEPNAEDFVPSTTARPSTIPPVPLSLLSVPDEVKTAMMECLKSNSSEPAYVRCAYPIPLPDMYKELFNITDSPTDTSNLNTSEMVLPASNTSEPLPQPSALEEVINVEGIILPLNSLQRAQAVKSVQKRSTEHDPMLNLMKYYVKHKVWINSNPVINDRNNMEVSKFDPFYIDNFMIKSKLKRSIDIPKIPEDPMQDISMYVKHKSGVNYVKDETQAKEIKSFLDKIRNSNNINKKYQNFGKRQKKIEKRSTFYEHSLIYPRISENPQQDISFYIKNKEGTNNNPSLVQAAQVRLGLEQVFQTGNIEVVRRFGSNYNPLIPAPLADGVIRSTLDI